MPQILKKPLQIGAVVAETGALVLGATAEKLRELAGDEAPLPVEKPPEVIEPHETLGEKPARATRTRSAVSNPKAAKRLRQREG